MRRRRLYRTGDKKQDEYLGLGMRAWA